MSEQTTPQQIDEHMNSNNTSNLDTKNPALVKIHQVKNLLPEHGFDGLTELLSLLEETQLERVQQNQPDQTASEERALMLDEVLELAEHHLHQTHGNQIIDDLLFGFAEVCTTEYVTEEDLATLSELLHNDCRQQKSIQMDDPGLNQNNKHSNTLNPEKVIQYQDQINQYADLAETKGLSGVLDILLALKEWLEWRHSPETNDAELTNVDRAGLDMFSNAIIDYFTLNNVELAVQQLFNGIGQLSGESIVPAEDIEEFSQVLIDEIHLFSTSSQSNPQPESRNSNPEPDTDTGEVKLTETNENIPEHLKEFVELLRVSANEMANSLGELLQLLNKNTFSQEQQLAVSDRFETELNKFTGVAGIAGFSGLQQSCEHIQENYLALQKEHFNLTEQDRQRWREWNDAVLDYLQSPLDQDRIQQLLIVHCAPGWSSTLDEGKTAELLVNLRGLDSTNDQNEIPQRQVEATDEDVSLSIPDDVFPELLDSLLEELPVLTEEFSQAVQYLSRGGRRDDVATAQRVAHTIKGAGNTVGIKGIANLTHHLEDILTALANADSLPGQVITSTLLR
nr:Hpt domain-containing protein [Gammaproteobacteria bacterium]